MKVGEQIIAILRAAIVLMILCDGLTGNEPSLGVDTVTFDDSFERYELGDRWDVITPSFSINDGRLVGHQEPERRHVAACRVPLAFRNGIFEFSFRLTDGESVHFVVDDKNCEQAHAGHLCRVSFTPSQVRIWDDREGDFRKDLYKAFLDSGRTIDRSV